MNTKRSEFNKAKQEILGIINATGESTAMEIALITGRTPENSSMRLLQYHRQGLLSRRKIHGKTRGYSLTERGHARLKWLESDTE